MNQSINTDSKNIKEPQHPGICILFISTDVSFYSFFFLNTNTCMESYYIFLCLFYFIKNTTIAKLRVFI